MKYMKFEKVDTSEWPDEIDGESFARLLATHLPEIVRQVEVIRGVGLVHCEMGVLEKATLTAFHKKDRDTLRYLDFAEEVFRRANADVENAVWVSYVEGFVLASPEDQRIRELLPVGLGEAFDEFKESYERQFGPIGERN